MKRWHPRPTPCRWLPAPACLRKCRWSRCSLAELAAHYGVEVEYRSDDVRSLRLFYQWEPEYSLDKVVEMLNSFDAISIRHEDNQLIVESKDLK